MEALYNFTAKGLVRVLILFASLSVFTSSFAYAQNDLGIGFILPEIIPGSPSESDTLTVGLSHSPPFILVNDTTYSGIGVWLWEKLAAKHAISYNYKNMTFSGVLDGLNNNEIDLSINPISITAQRSNFMRFSLPYYSTNSAVAILHKSFFSKTFDFLRTIFSLDFLKIISFLFLTLLFFGFLMWYVERKHNLDQFEPGLKGIWSGVWWSAVTMTTVGYGDKAPLTHAGRIIALIWMFTAILIISGFTGTVASSLTVQHLSWNIGSLDELKEHNIGTISPSASASYLKDHFFDHVTEYNTMDEALKALKKEDVDAIIYDEAILRYKLSEAKYRHIKLLPYKFEQQFYSIAFPSGKDHELEHKLSKSLLEITESDQWSDLLKKYKVPLL